MKTEDESLIVIFFSWLQWFFHATAPLHCQTLHSITVSPCCT